MIFGDPFGEGYADDFESSEDVDSDSRLDEPDS